MKKLMPCIKEIRIHLSADFSKEELDQIIKILWSTAWTAYLISVNTSSNTFTFPIYIILAQTINQRNWNCMHLITIN